MKNGSNKIETYNAHYVQYVMCVSYCRECLDESIVEDAGVDIDFEGSWTTLPHVVQNAMFDSRSVNIIFPHLGQAE